MINMVHLKQFVFVLAVIAATQAQDWHFVADNIKTVSAKGENVISSLPNATTDGFRTYVSINAAFDSNGNVQSVQQATVYDIASSVAVSADGWHWAVGRNNALWRLNKDTNQWESEPSGPTSINTISKNRVIGWIRGNVGVMNWNNHKSSWGHPQFDLPVISASIGEQDERWIIAADSTVWRRDPLLGVWNQVSGTTDAQIVCVQSPSRVMIRANTPDGNSNIYFYKNGSWVLLENPLSAGKGITIAMTSMRIWCTSDAFELFSAEY